MCEFVEQLKPQVASDAVHDLKHEYLIGDPQSTLKELCGFFGLSADDKYYKDCASIIFKSTHQTRHDVEWTPQLIASVKQQMDRFPFLSGYTYED